MERRTLLLVAVLGVPALGLLAVSVALQGLAVAWFFSDEGPAMIYDDYSILLEEMIDAQVDAGFDDLPLDPDSPLLRQRKVFLAHTVNSRSAKYVTEGLLHLNAVDPTRPIDLYISTQGGYPDSAFTIIDTMHLIDAPVNTWALGGCYSAGAMVLTAGTGTRRATGNTLIMVHTNRSDSSEPWSYDRLGLARYEKLWRETADLPEEWYPMTDDGTYYLNPAEALELGIVDEVVPASRAAARRGPD